MNRGGTKGRDTNRNVGRAPGFWGAVLHPLARIRPKGLPGSDRIRSLASLDVDHAAQNERHFVEFGRLARLNPPFGALHPGHADPEVSRVDSTDKLINQLRLVAYGFHSGGRTNMLAHGV